MLSKNLLTITASVFLVLNFANSFAPTPTFGVNRRHVTLFAGDREGDSGGGAAIAKPAVKIAQKVETKQKEKVKQQQKARTYDPISRRDEEFQEAPMFKLMLLGDDSYDAAHVIERMCAVVEDMDEDQAATVLQQANQAGKAMCGKFPLEIAELYKEQLIRSDPMIFSDLEEENK
jgi:ATP-dependent Clp protease adapter protein ClpS